jgi:hypothetical protein
MKNKYEKGIFHFLKKKWLDFKKIWKSYRDIFLLALVWLQIF